jgi:transcriptional regulator with XRE-family HTH domain
MDKFTKRLLEILETNNLSASQFAEKIGVQRSSVSHILSGRNKPSLDFIIKTSSVFSDVSLNWLIHGKKFDEPIISKEISPPLKEQIENSIKTNLDEKQLKQIVFFYKDNTFKIFKN